MTKLCSQRLLDSEQALRGSAFYWAGEQSHCPFPPVRDNRPDKKYDLVCAQLTWGRPVESSAGNELRVYQERMLSIRVAPSPTDRPINRRDQQRAQGKPLLLPRPREPPC